MSSASSFRCKFHGAVGEVDTIVSVDGRRRCDKCFLAMLEAIEPWQDKYNEGVEEIGEG